MPDEDRTEVSLLELCAPPAGYEFRRGLWCTHDLKMKVVTDVIVPELLGAESRVGEQRRREAASLASEMGNQDRLVIIHAASRYTPGPAFHSFVEPIAFSGKRRLHAKFAILQFDKIKGQGSKTRAFLTSANLTDGGVRNNREVVIWEPEVVRKRSETLCRDLLLLFKVLADDLPDSRNDQKAVIEQVRKRISQNGLSEATKLGAVVESLRDVTQMTSKFPSLKHATRIVVVSPAFGLDDNDQPARLLDRFLESRPVVEIYLGVDAGPGTPKAPQFSRAAYDYLRQRAGRLRLMTVPEWLPAADAEDGGPDQRRRLHAKLLAVVDRDGTAHVLAGSANFTERGLGGKNREAMVYNTRPAAQLDDFLAELGAAEWHGPPARPIHQDEDEGEIPRAQQVSAEFEPDVGIRSTDPQWHGTLRLTWQTPPDRIVYLRRSGEEQELEIDKVQLLKLDPQIAGLVVYHGQRQQRIHIQTQVHGKEDEFWALPHHDEEERPDQGLWRLLADLRRPARPKPHTEDDPQGRGLGRPQDGFFIRLEQRLVLLVRHRQKLNQQLSGKDAADLLEEYLRESTHQNQFAVETGRAVLGAYVKGVPESRDPLLRKLRDCLEHFSKERDHE